MELTKEQLNEFMDQVDSLLDEKLNFIDQIYKYSDESSFIEDRKISYESVESIYYLWKIQQLQNQIDQLKLKS